MVYKKIAAALRQARRAAAVTVSLTVLSMPAMADGQVLRIAMTASDIPLTTGQPDSGFEG